MKTRHRNLLSAFASRRLCCAVLAATACYFVQPVSLRSFSGELSSAKLVKNAIEQDRNAKASRAKPLRAARLRNEGGRRLLLDREKLKGRFFDVPPLPSF